ncbi:Crp/Fnr family transcriptional regulator [Vreelandella sp. V005]|uniref:Crp/Fnr family transcriptional regulator n=1 Tax=Vreelandella sp. V005 TaxID=3459608 RepID=UPI00404491B0
MRTLLITPNLLIIRKLESIFLLTAEERQVIHDLPIKTVTLRPDKAILKIGDQPTQCCLVVEGFICAYKLTSEGKRQILSIFIPGDIPDLQSLHLPYLDVNIASFTSSTLGFIEHDDMSNICAQYPRLSAAFWRETLVSCSIAREWLLNIGQRHAYNRIAHLICELMVRLEAVGLAKQATFELPITQVELADATGMTQIHVNRVLQALRKDGLISSNKNQITVLDWQKLKDAAEFDPLYLHLVENPT